MDIKRDKFLAIRLYQEQSTALDEAVDILNQSLAPGLTKLTKTNLAEFAFAQYFADTPELGRFPTYSDIVRSRHALAQEE